MSSGQPESATSQNLAPMTFTVDFQSLWAKYEDIAMHFNDLLLRLRTQALAAIAAISTLVGVFTKTDPAGAHSDWFVATGIFVALALCWIAIACIDLLYYNRLLVGAVTALLELEADAQKSQFKGITMSTKIGSEFEGWWWRSDKSSFTGVFLFYGIVLVLVLAGAGFSYWMHDHVINFTPSPNHVRHM